MPVVKDAKVFIQTREHRRGSRRSKALNVTAADGQQSWQCLHSLSRAELISRFLPAFLPPPQPPTISVCFSDASSCACLSLRLPASLRLTLLSSRLLTCSSPVTLRVGWLKKRKILMCWCHAGSATCPPGRTLLFGPCDFAADRHSVRHGGPRGETNKTSA